MKILVFNMHKYRHIIKAVKIIAFMLIIATVFAVAANSYMNSNRYVSAMEAANEKNLIIIDAGHGGEDPGAVGANGVYEKDLNLEIATILGELLEERGFAVLYTRTEDKLLYTEAENIKGIRKISDLKNRCKIAAEYQNATFISIHMNSFGDAKYSGLQVYYGTENELSRNLATSIQKNVKDNLQPENNRVVKPGKNMYVLENIKNSGVLIECGFLTNLEECEKLSEKEYQKQLSLAIVCGIIEYKEAISSY